MAVELQDVQNHLKVLSGGGLVLTTDQLARCLSMNPKVISRMRQEGRFPIRHKVIGTRKIVYPIHSVAAYLASDDQALTAPPDQSKSGLVDQQRSPSASRKSALPDLSKQMLMRGFLDALTAQHSNLYSLLHAVQTRVAHDTLQTELSGAKHPERKPISKV